MKLVCGVEVSGGEWGEFDSCLDRGIFKIVTSALHESVSL
jgi:hypothetical protein